ncbi:uncharacterized protein B0I36DRAFT_361704 [Microdochium trichocladiopsis]|uniref:DUF4048 domain-containing protein n=1 Tax=Microdochium trichocladiopsis TaxID=1682393 RepID=A0A9P9BRQ0_9PEZI|nr:uncharacterized protein B0I36DRAFT_361704 [Microdochium trichocladiopsis]KAH7032968.1 hypothetical protein B0I36DRAFT_361704 [Microdochium trichocladiopsis]
MYDTKSVDGEHWDQSVPPSPAPQSETCETRSIRSMSSASRNTNRLSITLPVALPNNPNEIIVAIAAQERRVLELREELSRAEGDLSKLKKQFTASEGRRKRASVRATEPLRAMTPSRDNGPDIEDPIAAKHKSEMDRRKAILLAQSQAPPKDSKRRVMRGGHTRTLSLLSPTRSTPDTPLPIDNDALLSPASATSEFQPDWQPNLARLNKRATWTPRQTQPPSGMKQIASDFRQGLWTFVEDLRQATVGDEAISGTSNRTTDMAARPHKMDSGDQDTIRASTVNRPRVPFASDDKSGSSTPNKSDTGDTGSRVQHRRSLSRPEPKSRKRFSWTPPTFDNLDDDDWSNWDSPTVKTSRWSGSTANGDIISAIPEKNDEGEGAGGQRQSGSEVRASTPPSTSKLEELPQAILNRLTPSGLKGLPSQFMKDWERSLSSPTDPNTFEASCRDIHAVTQ